MSALVEAVLVDKSDDGAVRIFVVTARPETKTLIRFMTRPDETRTALEWAHDLSAKLETTLMVDYSLLQEAGLL